MPITGSHPEKGIRIELSLVSPRRYEGAIVTPDARFVATADVDDEGNVTLTSEAPKEMAEKARLVLRTAVRHAAQDKTELPRRIVRWRGDK
ncbi:MAG TPA: hypothetical protein VF407_14350 [Polyangiaceae bacterium]